MLPTVVDNSYNFGHIHKSLLGHEIPIGSSVGFFFTSNLHIILIAFDVQPEITEIKHFHCSWAINRRRCGVRAVSIPEISR